LHTGLEALLQQSLLVEPSERGGAVHPEQTPVRVVLDASIWVRSGPVELSSSFTGMPVAFVKAAAMTLS
jgi:hypothetical protein